MIENKKASILLVLKVLEEYSDENHYLTHQKIIDKISSDYGIDLERKSVANCISILQELDYDIVKGQKGGFALLSRLFESSEATFLVDAIFSSKSISGRQAKQLSDKVSSVLSKYDRKSFNYLNKSSDVSRTMNAEVFYNIEIIHEAIQKKKWIEFTYTDYDKDGNETLRFDGYKFHASPCYMINNFGRYYFLGYRYKYNSVNTYRIDFMKDVRIFEERERIDPKTLEEFKNYSSISEYINEHIYMFGGQPISAVMEIREPHALQYVKDWFGHNVEIYKDGDKLMVRVRCNHQALFYWLMQYGEHIHLVSPQELVDEIKAAAERILENYK